MEKYDNLVCPVTKQRLIKIKDSLQTEDCKFKYPIINDIPILMEWQKFQDWNDELYKPSITQENQEPLPAHEYYVRFVDENWKTMLDLGCGDGVMSANCANLVDEIYCVNPGIVPLKILQRRNIPNMFPVVALGESLPFPDNFFDGVFNIFVIEHLKDPIPMLKEIWRVLKPTGKLLVSTDNRMYYKYLRYFYEWRKKGWGNWTKANPTHINLMYPGKLRKYVKKAGFEVALEDYGLTGKSKKERLFGQWIVKTYFAAGMRFLCQPAK